MVETEVETGGGARLGTGPGGSQESGGAGTRPPAGGRRVALRRALGLAILAAVVGTTTFLLVERSDRRPEPPPAPAADGPAVTVAAAGDAGEVLVGASGAGLWRSQEVTPGGPVVLAWAYDCALVPGASAAFAVTAVGTGSTPLVDRRERAASGTERSNLTGPIRLEVTTGCAWTVRLTAGR